MLIIPAIDIKDGCVVRLVQGRYDKKVYSRDPVKTARHWQKQGAKFLHLVDLDGAISGRPKNIEAVKQIVKATGLPLEFGGGVRSREAIRDLLRAGVKRVILGTRAIEDQGFLKSAFKEFKNRIILSLDVQAGKIMTRGWRGRGKATGLLKFAGMLKEMGFKQVIYTDISRDGTLKGPDLKGIRELIKKTGLEVIASGGISSLNDLVRLRLLDKKGLSAVIIGKALYEGRFTLSEALKLS